MNEHANKSSELLKEKIATQPILVFPSFERLFIIECDASNVAIGVVLSQDGKPISFHSKKLSD